MAKPTDDNQLTDKQRLFVDEYLKDLNATQAAIRAGYSENGARVQGHVLLTNPNIDALIEEKMHARSKRLEVTADRVVREIAKIAFANLKLVVRWDEEGNAVVVPSDDMDNTTAAAIAEVNCTKTRIKGELVSSHTRIKMHDKLKALETLCKHLGIFKQGDSGDLPPFGGTFTGTAGETALTLENLPLFMEIARRSVAPKGDDEA